MLLSWRNSPEVRKFMFTSQIITPEEHAEWFRKLQHNPDKHCYIHLNQHEVEDGFVAFTRMESEKSCASWGFYLSPDAAPGSGTPLGNAALTKAFGELQLTKLIAQVLVNNPRSIRFHEKMGFRPNISKKMQSSVSQGSPEVRHYYLTAGQWRSDQRSFRIRPEL